MLTYCHVYAAMIAIWPQLHAIRTLVFMTHKLMHKLHKGIMHATHVSAADFEGLAGSSGDVALQVGNAAFRKGQ